jgi:hypothetical protein
MLVTKSGSGGRARRSEKRKELAMMAHRQPSYWIQNLFLSCLDAHMCAFNNIHIFHVRWKVVSPISLTCAMYPDRKIIVLLSDPTRSTRAWARGSEIAGITSGHKRRDMLYIVRERLPLQAKHMRTSCTVVCPLGCEIMRWRWNFCHVARSWLRDVISLANWWPQAVCWHCDTWSSRFENSEELI